MPLITWVSVAGAASFDCHQANEIAEKVICGSQQLSLLDEQLNARYQQEINKNYVDQSKLIAQQRAWLTLRNKCQYSFDCLYTLIQRRMSEFSPKVSKPAYSWGGKLRAEPNLTSAQVGSTVENQKIRVITVTPQEMHGYQWFKIEANGIEAYQWGGILCAPSFSGSYCE